MPCDGQTSLSVLLMRYHINLEASIKGRKWLYRVIKNQIEVTVSKCLSMEIPTMKFMVKLFKFVCVFFLMYFLC